MPRGRLIAFEGGEASGKSTQAARFADRLGAVLTREPGGTALGEEIRQLVLHRPGPIDAHTEALLMLAARAEHVAEVVAPALAEGRHVVADRFSHSTLAYQGYGRGLDLGDLRRMCSWAASGLWPELVVLIVVPRAVALARLGNAGDRLESAGEEFHARVNAGFEEMAATDPANWLVVDGDGAVDEVADRVWSAYSAWADRRRPTRAAGPGR
ncbi:MAG TPA: dTMP kinase [Acidimicrobiales bacterium]|nr:dTMP kinase [Acidimicrobiales bacterium]